MDNHIVALLLGAVLPLAACNSGPSVQAENATVGEVANQVASVGGTGSFVSPGKWLSKITVEEMTMPGMPPEVAAHMKDVTGSARTHQSCLTPEQARQPKGDFFGASTNCRYDHFTMAEGKIDALMTCTEPRGTQVMQMTGSYSADSYAMTMASTSSGSGPSAGMKMRMRVEAKRIGACDGTEDKS